jgi:hypothetical protein
MNRDQALSKIKKCLALARSGNTAEAAAGMRQAQKLMAEHRISDHELSMIDVQEVKVKACSTAMNAWEVRLSHMVADAFGCESFGSASGSFNGAGNYVRRLDYVFVGVNGAATVAGYAFEVLTRQCAKARLAHIQKQPKNCKPITKTSRGDEFAKGWVVAVSSLVEKFANPEANEQLLLDYLEAKHPDLKKAKTRDTTKGRKVDYGHSMAGYAAGEKAQLNRGMPGALRQELLS